jgi:hypothetical protein
MDRHMGCQPRNRWYYRPLLADLHAVVTSWEQNLDRWRRRELALTIALIAAVAAACGAIVWTAARLEKPPYAPRYPNSTAALLTALESRGAVFGRDSSARVTQVMVQSPGFQDADVARLAGLPDLQTVLLVGTPVTDAGALSLRTLPKLRSIHLIDTQVTEAGIRSLRAALPQAHVRVARTVDK